MIAKTVLLGMNNPDPVDAFRAQKKTGSGYRLLSYMNEYLKPQKIKIDAFDFERMFDRQNMLDEAEWSVVRAKERKRETLRRLAGRRVIICGNGVAFTLGLNVQSDFEWFTSLGIEWCKIPHPSGVNRLYNIEHYRISTGALLWKELQNGVLWHCEHKMNHEHFLTNRWPEEKWSYPPT
ncbi:hypothetical protein EVB55_090 [Rhizobium phage RHph_Y68]|uniref:Uncharacterized protein n=1 Tax=Rhizobium phage RHph_Y68 TaxID=2509787 RepID=A0A7S5URN2_9CAUD|nr:hypothetical protein PP934_gp090 [Rhizobium phage RHph_Y68]QIG68025.1 hypothetical protein EVB55_090 [Rhizobium phage RHph_Y68]